MNELLRTNLFLADSDSVNNIYDEIAYIKKFKSAILMAKSIGLNPNMIIDSNGFEKVINDCTIKKFFIHKIEDSEKEGIDYSINIHIFGDFIENEYFNNSPNNNPFLNYYNEKMKDSNYLFSSFNCTKKDIEKNTILKNKLKERLISLDNFNKEIYNKTSKNIFKVNKSPIIDLRESIIKKLNYSISNINSNTSYSDILKKEYFNLLTTFNDLIINNKEITNRSHFYELLKHKELNSKNSEMIHSLKIDIIDVTYNSSFIKSNEVFRYKNLPTLDNVYSKFFDSYANDGLITKTLRLYNEFDKIKSKFEVIDLALSMNPLKIIDFLADELMNKVEEKNISTLHRVASYILPKTKLLGISDSKNLLIGVKS